MTPGRAWPTPAPPLLRSFSPASRRHRGHDTGASPPAYTTSPAPHPPESALGLAREQIPPSASPPPPAPPRFGCDATVPHALSRSERNAKSQLLLRKFDEDPLPPPASSQSPAPGGSTTAPLPARRAST